MMHWRNFDNDTLNAMTTQYHTIMRKGTHQEIREYLANFAGDEALLNEIKTRAGNDVLVHERCVQHLNAMYVVR
jgi:hypothetical protein